MFKNVKAAAEYAVLAYTAVIAVKGLAWLAVDTAEYVKDKIQDHKKKD
jgi:hypothetical protein